jgi:uncharacterized protein YbjQ (UPF0145 family)
MFVSTTTHLHEPYDVIDTIMFFDTYQKKGMFGSGGYDLEASFEESKAKMLQIAQAKGGDAIIGCDFELRFAVAGNFVPDQVFELFCFGTVVKLRNCSQDKEI